MAVFDRVHVPVPVLSRPHHASHRTTLPSTATHLLDLLGLLFNANFC